MIHAQPVVRRGQQLVRITVDGVSIGCYANLDQVRAALAPFDTALTSVTGDLTCVAPRHSTGRKDTI